MEKEVLCKIVLMSPWSMLTDEGFFEWMIEGVLFTGSYEKCKERMKNPDELVREFHVRYDEISIYPSSVLFFYEGNHVGSLFLML